MRKRICQEICPNCKTAEHTTYKRKDQFYCKKCNGYFKVGRTIAKLSKNTISLFKALVNLYQFKDKKPITLKIYRKKAENSSMPLNVNQSNIKYCEMKYYNTILANNELNIDTNVINAIILVRKGNNFIVVRNLGIEKGIAFKNAVVHIESINN